MMKDLFGIGWRPELAAGIMSNLDQIDIVEVIADDYFDAPKANRRALKTLATQVPVTLHGVTLGPATATPLDVQRLDRLARLIGEVTPRSWSEHLSFVRAGGIEIGHLAAPPRTDATVEGAASNLARARLVVGASPRVENVATPIDPPGSTRSEADWTREILSAADCHMLLDLHNLYANSVNFDFHPLAYIDALPARRIDSIHLAGGRWIKAESSHGQRRLDDHLHDVPEEVYALLTYVGEKTDQPLTVILERDGNYPAMKFLLAQLQRARAALEDGRYRRAVRMAAIAA